MLWLTEEHQIGEWNGGSRAYGYSDTFEWVAFDADEGEHFVSDPSLEQPEIPDTTYFPFVKPTRQEIERFVILSDWWRAKQEGHIVVPTIPTGRPRLLIRDVRPAIYFDCVAEVLAFAHS